MELNVELINSGGFSNVYVVVNRESKLKFKLNTNCINSVDYTNPMCIKVSSVDKGTCEYTLLQSIKHENIIQTLFGYYDQNEGMFIFGMPAYECELGSKELTINYMHLIKQTLSGLHYLHTNGIVHCDIKPSNILATRQGSSRYRYVIIDLNIANTYKQGGLHKRFRCNLNAPIIGTKQFASLFALLRCLPFCRDDIESFFLVCLNLKKMKDDPVFVDPDISLLALREMRIDMNKYRCIQYARSLPFYATLDYNLIYDLMIDEFADV